jgi:hypothetical protein
MRLVDRVRHRPRRALERGRTQRFSSWWTTRDGLTDDAQRLSGHCNAEIVAIENADAYFGRLADACDSLEALNRKQPASIDVAVASAKSELDGQHRAVSVHDRLRDEMPRIAELPMYTPSGDYPANEHGQRLEGVAAEIEMVVALVAVTAYWGTPDTDHWWIDDIERLGRFVRGSGGMHAFGLPRQSSRPCRAVGGRRGRDRSTALRDRRSPVDRAEVGSGLLIDAPGHAGRGVLDP